MYTICIAVVVVMSQIHAWLSWSRKVPEKHVENVFIITCKNERKTYTYDTLSACAMCLCVSICIFYGMWVRLAQKAEKPKKIWIIQPIFDCSVQKKTIFDFQKWPKAS